MKLSRKYVYIILAIVFIVSLAGTFGIFKFINTNAANQSIGLPSSFDNMDLFSYEENFVSVVSTEGVTTVSLLNTNSNLEFEELDSISGDYATANIAGKKIFVTFNLDGTGVRILQYRTDGSVGSNIILNSVHADSDKFVVASNDIVCYVDNKKQNILNFYNRTQGTTSSLEMNVQYINLIKLDPSGTTLYVKADNKLYKVDVASLNFSEYTETSDFSAKNFSFIDDNTIIATDGWIYRKNGDEFIKLFYKGSITDENIGGLYGNDIIVNISETLLYTLDYNTGTPLREYRSDNEIIFAIANDNAVLIAAQSDNGIEYKLEKDEFEAVKKQKFSDDGTNKLSKSEITDQYKMLKPKATQLEEIYLQQADFDEFKTPGSLTDRVLTDSINAINFYRRIYGLGDLELNNSLCSELQYTAALCMVNDDLENPSKPDSMSDEFYSKAFLHLKSAIIQRVENLTPTLIAEQVNYWFNNDVYFRDMILSSNATEVAFAMVTDEDGKTVIAFSDTNNSFSIGERSFVSYPNSGDYMTNWLEAAEHLSLDINEENLLCGDRSKPYAMITNNINGEVSYCEYGKSLTISEDNKKITINYPLSSLENDTSYTIRIDNLYTNEGIASYIQYELSMFQIDINEDDAKLTSDVYNIDDQRKIITGIEAGTNLVDLLADLNYDKEIYSLEYVNYKGEIKSTGNVGTSGKLLLINGVETKNVYTLIVYGDLTGEGNINSRDKTLLYNYLLGKAELKGAYLIAADINRDGVIDTKDLLFLEKNISEDYEIPQK